jgi:hypothetical protein
MDAQARPADDSAVGHLLRPDYWLVFGLEWTDDTAMAEAALAIAPSIVSRSMISEGAQQILKCANLLARKRGHRVVFFTDLTRMFASGGTTWEQLGIDWAAVLEEFRAAPFPAMYLTISQRAHAHICNAAKRLTFYWPDGEEQATESERDLVRKALTRQLTADWPPYVRGLIDTGKTIPAS